MKDKHPSFKNPTIQEVVCEIYFQMPDNIKWNPVFFGTLFKQIQREFPEQEPVMHVDIQLQLGNKGLGQTFLPPQQWVRYKHTSKKLILQLTEGIMAVNILKYSGWEKAHNDILDCWKKVSKIIKPKCITRIGLRYINRIKRDSSDEKPTVWLKANKYIPDAVLSSQPGFLSRIEVGNDDFSRMIVTLGEIEKSPVIKEKDIILDIDCIVEKAIQTNKKDITKEINTLHELVWQIFSGAIGDKLVMVLKGE